MNDRLYTCAEAAALINPALDRLTFKRYADRLNTPYHKIGRERYYTAQAVQHIKEGTLRWPGGEKVQDSDTGATPGSSAGPKEDRRASVAQARAAARRQRLSSRGGSRSSVKSPEAVVYRLNT